MMLFCRHESHDALKGSCAKFCGGRLSAAPPPPAAPVLSDKEILKWYRATPQFSTAWAESEEEIIAIGRALLSKAQP
jgi:hypothetical protein